MVPTVLGVVAAAAAAAAASDFLFFEPLGLPLPRFTGTGSGIKSIRALRILLEELTRWLLSFAGMVLELIMFVFSIRGHIVAL